MRFRNIFQRYVNCPTGSLYYVCDASNYSGCCMVDACHYDEGCPAGESVVGTTIGAATTATTAASSTAAVSTSAAATSSSGDRFITTSTAQESTSTIQPTTASTDSYDVVVTVGSTVTSTVTSTAASATASAGGSETTSDAGGIETDTSTGTPASTTASTTGTNTADRVSGTTATATATATPAASPSHKKSFPAGAIGGIVAGVVVLLAVAAFFLVRRRRQQARKKTEDASNGSGEHMLSGELEHNAGAGAGARSGGPTPTVSPLGEKGAFQSPTPLSAASTPALGGGDGFAKGAVEMSGSPANSAVLFGELPGSDATRYGAYAARAKGGVYPAISELDSASPSRAELDTPQSTPGPTPLSTPQIGASSPNPSLVSGSNGGRSTVVSSWRSSSRTMGADAIAEGPEQQAQQAQQDVPPGPEPGQPVPPASESPRPNLDLSQAERGSGVHVASWNAYQG